MSFPMNHGDPQVGADAPLSFASNWTINVSDIRTLKISNISLSASEQDIREFFSFSGEIHYIEMQRESETSQLAYVTFKDSQGADTAMLLTGATIVDRSVTITPVENYQMPPEALSQLNERMHPAAADSVVVKKAEDVVSSMLAKGFVLGKDALNKAKAFDDRHHLISNASATVASIDQKIGLSEKLSIGTAVVNEKVREVDEKYHVLEKTRSAFSVAEQKASIAGSALMNNKYVSTGASWVSNALNMVAKAAEDVTTMTKEKVEKAEEEKKVDLCRVRTGMVNEFAQVHLDNEPVVVVSSQEPPVVPVNSMNDKLGNV